MTSSGSPSSPPGLLDLFKLAQDNDTHLAKKFATTSRNLQELSVLVQSGGRVSINMRLVVLNAFLLNNTYENIHQWAKRKTANPTSPITSQELVENKLGSWYPKRIGFETCFQNGEAFNYGALNIGSLGPDHYGDYCIVLKEDVWTEPRAYLQGDSLLVFMDSSDQLRQEELKEAIASQEQRHALMALKHETELPSWIRNEWPEMVCSQDRYVEVVFVQSLEKSFIEEVRMKKSIHDRLDDLSLFIVALSSVSPVEKMELVLFDSVMEHLKNQGIPVVTLT